MNLNQLLNSSLFITLNRKVWIYHSILNYYYWNSCREYINVSRLPL